VATSSVEEARDAVTDVYLPHALRADGGVLRMRLNAARQRRFTLGFLVYGAHAELGMPPTETTYHVNLTTRGKTFAERGDGTRAVTAGSCCCPTSSTPSAGPTTPSSSSSRSRVRGWRRGYVSQIHPSRLRAVLTHMETHADQPLTPGELAKVGCMSVRSLHATFQHELGLSPMAHLRRIRLDRVHAELLRAGDSQVRISDVAMRWGFFHPSRFARQYQERFGELPSGTARRGTA